METKERINKTVKYDEKLQTSILVHNWLYY